MSDAHLVMTEVEQPEQRGSLQSSHANIVAELLYRLTIKLI